MIGRKKFLVRMKECGPIHLRQSFISQSTSSETSSASEEQTPESVNDIAELRDLSRMRPWHRSLLHGEPPPIDTFKWQKERWAMKERYAMYGRASGVDPGVHWPTSEELKEIQQEDEEFYPKLLPTMEEAHQSKAQREKEIEDRYVEVEKKAKQYPKILAAYRKKLQEQQAAIDKEKQSRDTKIKEIQSYFGFAIDVTDPRFAAMMAIKELEEKQAKRKVQKRQKEMEAMRRIEEETKLLKQREHIQLREQKTEDDAKAKAA